MFIPFGFMAGAPAAAGGFDPESYGQLYYWWDFTDSSTMTLNGSNVLSAITSKAARSSANSTLDAVDGSPTFESIAEGTRFDNSDAISNTNIGGTGGDLDTLSDGANATVIIITKIVSLTNPSSNIDDMVWSFAGTGADDMGLVVSGRTSNWSNNTICSSDNAISSTYNRQLSLRDWNGGDRWGTRTYTDTQIPTDDTIFQMFTCGVDWTGGETANIALDDQALCSAQLTSAGRRSNTSSNRGFKVNARSRSGAGFSADQNIQHCLIYDGLLSDVAVTNIYNSWGG